MAQWVRLLSLLQNLNVLAPMSGSCGYGFWPLRAPLPTSSPISPHTQFKFLCCEYIFCHFLEPFTQVHRQNPCLASVKSASEHEVHMSLTNQHMSYFSLNSTEYNSDLSVCACSEGRCLCTCAYTCEGQSSVSGLSVKSPPTSFPSLPFPLLPSFYKTGPCWLGT